jgi:hypothetical protein
VVSLDVQDGHATRALPLYAVSEIVSPTSTDAELGATLSTAASGANRSGVMSTVGSTGTSLHAAMAKTKAKLPVMDATRRSELDAARLRTR